MTDPDTPTVGPVRPSKAPLAAVTGVAPTVESIEEAAIAAHTSAKARLTDLRQRRDALNAEIVTAVDAEHRARRMANAAKRAGA